MAQLVHLVLSKLRAICEQFTLIDGILGPTEMGLPSQRIVMVPTVTHRNLREFLNVLAGGVWHTIISILVLDTE